MEDKRPYRRRVEVVAINPAGEVLAGVYENEGCPALPGGGLADDETWVEAALRELEEETGFVAQSEPVLLPVPVVHHDWKPPYVSAAQAERAKTHRGSETRWVLIEVGYEPSVPPRERLDCQGLRFRTIAELDLLGDETRASNPHAFLGRRAAWHTATTMRLAKPRPVGPTWLAAALTPQR